ncbi:MAG: helix-turn-helix domain-containing protein [Methylobacter sp.]|uniref:helix-turn-helix domain-containing protein n=1 Tax=Methylobacter sp. TaxID=2051955 RepID=UPI0025D85E04|nr:helix-turn-helix transcriptional regulator [Methylobacter sp.]MCK9621975.1 helix-turn-helix domain-containing protein [Methylobacter sp.]
MHEEIKEKLLNHFGKKTEIARFLGTNRQTINHWFNGSGKPDVRSAMKLAKALDIDWLDIRHDLRDV